jgi:hypothetical protein
MKRWIISIGSAGLFGTGCTISAINQVNIAGTANGGPVQQFQNKQLVVDNVTSHDLRLALRHLYLEPFAETPSPQNPFTIAKLAVPY